MRYLKGKRGICVALALSQKASDRSITQYVDIVNNIIYGETDHFSIFGVR